VAGGYQSPLGDGLDVIRHELQTIFERLREIEAPAGTQVNSLVAQVQAAIANINTTVTAAIAATSYDAATIDAKIASPGNIAPANVTASGQVDSAGSPLKSQPSYGYMVTTGYKGLWIDGATYQVGYSPSTEAVKTDLTPMDADDAAQLLGITPYWGRYLWDDPSTPPKAFFLADEVRAAGFGPDVAPVVEGEPLAMVGADGLPVLSAEGEPVVIPAGEAYTVNYSQIVVPLVAIARAQASAIADLTARLAAAGL
jgi:hypothetical protein